MFESETQEPVKMCVLIKIMFRKNNCLFCLSMFINSFFFFLTKILSTLLSVNWYLFMFIIGIRIDFGN